MFDGEVQLSPITIVGRRGPRVAVNLRRGCFLQYEARMEMCNAIAFHMGGVRATALCKQRAL
jgi:hypothetical protein